MFVFYGSLKNPAGERHTLSELVAAAINARTYVSAQAKADALSRFRNVTVCNVAITPKDGTIYLMDAYKGVSNGIVNPALLVAGDFTAEPGGGIPLEVDAGPPVVNTDPARNRFACMSLSSTVVYSVADEVFYLEVTVP